jgi:undecaprenyl-diphosphatase
MKRLLSSCLGLGWLPVAPGTWGSIPPAVIFMLLCYLGAPSLLVLLVMLAMVLLGSIVCLKCSSEAVAVCGRKDPGEVVADEFAGQAVVFLAAGAVADIPIWVVTLAGFLLFRLFDIFKPWPIRKLEKFPNGWGILADDLLAGVYAAFALVLCLSMASTVLSGNINFAEGQLTVLKSVVLGAIQGLTEFLPVSSSGHLVLFETFFKLDPETPAMLLFDLATHVGTVVAVLIVFRKSIVAFFRNLAASGKYVGRIEVESLQKGPAHLRRCLEIYRRSPSVHMLTLAILATFVTGVFGLLFEKYFSEARGSLTVVAAMWIVTGTMLLITDSRKKTRVGLRQFAMWQAMVIGLAQAVAIMPGISRSGATICAAILIGWHRRWAVEFSFLIAIPAIMGATLLTIISDAGEISSDRQRIGWFCGGGSCGNHSIKAVNTCVKKRKAEVFCFILLPAG